MFRKLCLAIFCFVTASALAQAAPSPVTGIAVEKTATGVVIVHWQPVAEPVMEYRVYYKDSSILESNGEYDDVENTVGPETKLKLIGVMAPETGAVLYVSVLAVDAGGEESPFFAEEAVLVGPTGAGQSSVSSSKSSSSSMNPLPPMPSALTLSVHRVVSPTQLELTFSAPIQLDSNPDASMNIVAADGAALPISGMKVSGTMLTLDTMPQMQGVNYTLSLGTSVRGADGSELAQESRTVAFQGSTSAQVPPVMPPVAQNISGIENLKLQAEPQGRNGVTMHVRWTPVWPANDIASYMVRQSGDGQTYGTESLLAGDTTGIDIPNVRTPVFGISVSVVTNNGQRLPEEKTSMPLGTPEQIAAFQSPFVANTNQQWSNDGLSDSGPATVALSVIIAAGLLTGWAVTRRRVARG